MTAKLDLAGQRYGALVAIERLNRKPGRSYTWMCICDCGREYLTTTNSLRSGNTTRCLRCANSKYAPGEFLYHQVIIQYQANAKRRGLIWELSRETAKTMLKDNCSYCGKQPHEDPAASKNYGDDTIYYNGIDRIDSAIGYIEINVTTACFICNRSKSNLAMTDWLKHLDRIAEFRR